MRLIKQLKDSKGRAMNLYLYEHNNDEFLFKEIKNDYAVEYELFVQKLAGEFSVATLKFLKKATLNNKKGLLMNYLKGSVLLCHHKRNLNKEQKRELQRIILLDLLIANKDRHAANLFINKHITAFDHDKILKDKTRDSSAFVKLDLGRKLDKDYIEKVENMLKKEKITTKTALLKYFGFDKKDILKIKSITGKEIHNIIDSIKLNKTEKKRIIDFLIYRRDNFDSLPYV